MIRVRSRAEVDYPINKSNSAGATYYVTEADPKQVREQAREIERRAGEHPDRDQVHIRYRMFEPERDKSCDRPNDCEYLPACIAGGKAEPNRQAHERVAQHATKERPLRR